jgi:mevalonate kinase
MLQLFSAPSVAASATLALPAGAGLGASAALGVALARALAGLCLARGQAAPSIAEAALAWENVFHGNASGVDTAAAEHGGYLWFRRGQSPEPLAPARPLELLIALVEGGASTRLMVEGVAARRAAEPSRVDALMAEIARLVERARSCLLAGEQVELGRLMSRNHQLLVELGVSTSALDRAVSVAEGAGALGAKLTGAGGGGCAVALVDAAHREQVRKAWHDIGLSCWPPAS